MTEFIRNNSLLFGEVEGTESDEEALQVDEDGVLQIVGEDDD